MKVSYSAEVVWLDDGTEHLVARIDHIPSVTDGMFSGLNPRFPDPWLVWRSETTACGRPGPWSRQGDFDDGCDGCFEAISGAYEGAPAALRVPASP
jgi:hypothetical protein